MKGLKQSFGIDDTYTKLYRRPTKASEMTKVKEQIPLIEDYNYMADILYLPTDKFGFNKLLVICDIARDDFDIEKMKGETAEEALSAFKKMQKRNIIKIPYASILTDGGSSFKGVFHKYLYENGVNHRVARVGRHHQLSNVDSLCRQLGDIFNGIMNKKEAETGKISKAWTHAIDEVREKLNKYRISRGVKLPKDITTYEYPIFDNLEPKIKHVKKGGGDVNDDNQQYTIIKPKYKVGDLVNVLLEEPQTILGKKQPTKSFRMGDLRLEKKKRKILKVLYYNGPNPYRYLIEGLPNASYTEQELKQV
jgi:DNA-binding Lrp family transcriptional regulator